MAIATVAALKSAFLSGREQTAFSMTTRAVVVGRTYSGWKDVVPAAATPTTAAVVTRATAGAFGQQNADTGQLSLIAATLGSAQPGVYWIVDRLIEHGGLDATLTSGQTTNLPTPTLPARASGFPVWMALEIYTQLGSTATTVTVAYTTGAGSRTTPAVAFGGVTHREVARLILLPLADGNAMTTVDSVTLAGSTDTAGNFGVTLLRPILAVCVDAHGCAEQVDLLTGRGGGGIPVIPDDACLALMAVGTTTTCKAQGVITTVEN